MSFPKNDFIFDIRKLLCFINMWDSKIGFFPYAYCCIFLGLIVLLFSTWETEEGSTSTWYTNWYSRKNIEIWLFLLLLESNVDRENLCEREIQILVLYLV